MWCVQTQMQRPCGAYIKVVMWYVQTRGVLSPLTLSVLRFLMRWKTTEASKEKIMNSVNTEYWPTYNHPRRSTKGRGRMRQQRQMDGLGAFSRIS